LATAQQQPLVARIVTAAKHLDGFTDWPPIVAKIVPTTGK